MELNRAAINKQLEEQAAGWRILKLVGKWTIGAVTGLMLTFICWISSQLFLSFKTLQKNQDDFSHELRVTQDQLKQVVTTLDTLRDIPIRVANLEREQQERARKQDSIESQLSELSGYIKGLNTSRGSDATTKQQ